MILIINIFILSGCGGGDDSFDKGTVPVSEVKLFPFAKPLLIKPLNSSTDLSDINITISGHINSSVYVDGLDTGIDINSSGLALVPLTLEDGLNTFEILLKNIDNKSNTLIYQITKKEWIDTKNIKVLELGYIQDSTVTDFGDNVADYNQSTKYYTFEDNPGYSIYAKNGNIEDINLSENVDLQTDIGGIVSPITTIISQKPDTKAKIADLLKITNGHLSFTKDYILENDLNFAKVSQSLYVSLKDENVSSIFTDKIINDLDTISSVHNFVLSLSSSIEDSNLTLIDKYFYNKLAITLDNYDENVSLMSENFKDTRYSMDQNYTFHTRYILNTNQTVCFDKNNPNDTIDCSDENATGDGLLHEGLERNITSASDTLTYINADRIWQDDGDVNNNKLIFDEAKSYCENLTLNSITNWELPSIEDLNNIVDRNSTTTDLTDSNFNNHTDNIYWSNTPYVNLPSSYWVLSFHNGMSGMSSSSSEYYVRCISKTNE